MHTKKNEFRSNVKSMWPLNEISFICVKIPLLFYKCGRVKCFTTMRCTKDFFFLLLFFPSHPDV